MKKKLIIIAALLIGSSELSAQSRVASAQKIKALVASMTLEEKVGQMAQVAVDQIGTIDPKTKTFTIDNTKLTDVVIKYKIGSILNTPSGIVLDVKQWNAITASIQKAVSQTRLKVPLIYGLDDIHGVNYVAGFTSFPQQIGQAATWNRELAYRCGEITAYESRAAGVPWSFSPVMDLGINPAWPRLWETYGEDPLLSAEMGSAFIRGMQNPLGHQEKVAVTVKHFMGYSDPKYGKDRTNAWIPENYLREYHLPSFAAAIKAGGRSVMVNSALVNGVPSHMNKHLLTGILKGELNFTGFIVTDWQDIENIRKRDKIAGSNKEALMLCINAGIDMSMIPYNYQEFCKDLTALVQEGKVPRSRIDDAVSRILKVKHELNLFNVPVTNASGYPKFGSNEFTRAAYTAASESITLLKNVGQTLPLGSAEKILVAGPNANTMRPLNSGWSYTWQGERTDEFTAGYNTIVEALEKKLGKQRVSFCEVVSYLMADKYDRDTLLNIDRFKKMASEADKIVLCIGENSYTETPGNTNDINLSPNQRELVKIAASTGKPVVLVLNEGRPRIITDLVPQVSAIVQTYLPGNFGGDALADILSGTVNPGGKLPYTYPRYVNSLTPYIHKPSDESANPQGAYDYSADFDPLYAFGFGLSYTTFAYSNLTINKKTFFPGETATISLTVKNAGMVEGQEVIQLFIGDVLASVTPDVKRLRGFEKILLKPGAERTISFKVPLKNLAYVTEDHRKLLEKGEFKINVGTLSGSFDVSSSLLF